MHCNQLKKSFTDAMTVRKEKSMPGLYDIFYVPTPQEFLECTGMFTRK